MSNIRLSAVFQDRTTKGNTRLCLISLADQAADDGYCWPSMANIAERTVCEKRTVIRTIKKLEQMGHVIVCRTTTGAKCNNRYIVTTGQTRESVVLALQHRFSWTLEAAQKATEVLDPSSKNDDDILSLSDSFTPDHSLENRHGASDILPPSSDSGVTNPSDILTGASDIDDPTLVTSYTPKPLLNPQFNHQENPPLNPQLPISRSQALPDASGVASATEVCVEGWGRFCEFWGSKFPAKQKPSPTLKRKFTTRCKQAEFAAHWQAALQIASESAALQQLTWFTPEYFLRNDRNWRKCRERFMAFRDHEFGAAQTPQSTGATQHGQRPTGHNTYDPLAGWTPEAIARIQTAFAERDKQRRQKRPAAQSSLA